MNYTRMSNKKTLHEIGKKCLNVNTLNLAKMYIHRDDSAQDDVRSNFSILYYIQNVAALISKRWLKDIGGDMFVY